MRSNIQNTVQRVFGFTSVRATGLQMVGTFLPLSLMSRLMCWLRLASTRLFERVMAPVALVVNANYRGYGGHRANQIDSPGATGLKPSLGFDLASRVGWIAG